MKVRLRIKCSIYYYNYNIRGGYYEAIKVYSMRVAMLCRLYDLKLINDKEYTKIMNRLENDYKKRDRK